MTNAINPAAPAIRRSQLYRWHQQHGALYTSRQYPDVVSGFGRTSDERQTAKSLAICDLSLLGRTGFKGRGAYDWLAQYATLPRHPNGACFSPLSNYQGASALALLARLSNEEFLIIDHIAVPEERVVSAGVSAFLNQNHNRDKPQRTYSLPRQDSHCLIAVSGRCAPQLLSKMCAIDLSVSIFAAGTVAQTSIARLNAIIIRIACDSTPVYYVLADVSAAEYLWGCLLDGMHEYSGAAIGIDGLRCLWTTK